VKPSVHFFSQDHRKSDKCGKALKCVGKARKQQKMKTTNCPCMPTKIKKKNMLIPACESLFPKKPVIDSCSVEALYFS
jgi:hypothetical protein